MDPRVERMMQLESLFTKDPNLLRDYFFSRRDRVDYERARRDSFDEGKAEGEAKGRAKGKTEGVEETAAALLREKVDILLVSRVTGLSTERLRELQNPTS